MVGDDDRSTFRAVGVASRRERFETPPSGVAGLEKPRVVDTCGERDGYDDYMGRWSQPVARRFLEWLGVPAGSDLVDVGCGTGALAATTDEEAAPSRLSWIDPSPGFIRAASRRLGERAELTTGTAESLPFESDSFDAAVSGLAKSFFPEPEIAIREMRRVTTDGGAVAAYVWDYADGMEMIRRFWDAAVTLNPAIAHLDEATRFPLCHTEPLTALFRSAELMSVQTTTLDIPTVFSSFEEYWRPMLGDQGPAPSYVGALSGPDCRSPKST